MTEIDFETKMIEAAVQFLTPRQKLVLVLTDQGIEIVKEGAYAYVGSLPISPRTVNALLRVCAIKPELGSEIGGFERYTINGTGKKILDRFGEKK